jgi:hypothetical protein
MGKLEALKVGGVQKEEKRQKTKALCELENLLFFLLSFHYSHIIITQNEAQMMKI